MTDLASGWDDHTKAAIATGDRIIRMLQALEKIITKADTNKPGNDFSEWNAGYNSGLEFAAEIAREALGAKQP